jgi:two-component system, NarL family, invasion response regulator UvrY
LIVARFLIRHSVYVMRESVKNVMMPLQVVIADDAEEIRSLLDLVLSEIEGIAVRGKAKNGAEALRMVKDFHPDVVVLDVSMPEKSGIEVLQEIRRDDISTTIIMFTIDPHLREYSLNAGADYFLSKNEIGELVEIIQQLSESRWT